MSRPRKYPEELLERRVRLAFESERPIVHVAADLGIHSETLRKRVRRAEADQGLRPDLPTSEKPRKSLLRSRFCLSQATCDLFLFVRPCTNVCFRNVMQGLLRWGGSRRRRWPRLAS